MTAQTGRRTVVAPPDAPFYVKDTPAVSEPSTPPNPVDALPEDLKAIVQSTRLTNVEKAKAVRQAYAARGWEGPKFGEVPTKRAGVVEYKETEPAKWGPYGSVKDFLDKFGILYTITERKRPG